MSTAIYQKYRPNTFQEVLGQDLVKKILLNALKRKSVGHAYLFTGPRGTGKTSIARLIAKSLNCKNPKDGDACGECDVCLAIQESRYIDLIEIDAASNRGIDEIRSLKEKVNFAPAEGNRKVYIIDEVHMMTKEAFNALLKTLEEPPEYVVFIMATTEPHKIPATILSRVQRFDLKLANKIELTQKLKFIADREGVSIEDGAIEKLFQLSGGSFRDSESLFAKLLNAELKKDKTITIKEVEDAIGLMSSDVVQEFVDLLIAGNSNKAIKFIEDTLQKGYSIDQLVSQALYDLRDRVKQYYNKSGNYDLRRLVLVISQLSDSINKLKDATIPSLPLEIAVYNLDTGSQTNNTVKGVEKETTAKTKSEKVIKDEINVKKLESRKETSKTKKVENQKVDEAPKEKKTQKMVGRQVTLEELNSKWADVIVEIKDFNHHLYAFIAASKIKGVENNVILMDVAYKFHKQKIESIKSKQVLHKIFIDKFDAELVIECQVNPDLVKKREDGEDLTKMSNEDLVEEIFSDI